MTIEDNFFEEMIRHMGEEEEYLASIEHAKLQAEEQEHNYILSNLNSDFIKYSDPESSWISVPNDIVKLLNISHLISDKSCISNDEKTAYLSIPDDTKIFKIAARKFLGDKEWDISIGVTVESDNSPMRYINSYKNE